MMRQIEHLERMNSYPDELTTALMTTSTQMKFVRRIEVTPSVNGSNIQCSQLYDNLGRLQSLPKTWTNIRYVRKPMAKRRSQKILSFIGCWFISTGIVALSIAVIGLIIIFQNADTMVESDIEKYELGDLHYGINILNQTNVPSDVQLSSTNKKSIEKYLSDQLIDKSGYRALSVDRVSVQNQSVTKSCSSDLFIENIKIYFDLCTNCTQQRNLVLSRSFFNPTAFQKSVSLVINNLHALVKVCSALNTPRFIVPIQFNNSHEQKRNPSLLVNHSRIHPPSTTVSTSLVEEITNAKSMNDVTSALSFTVNHLSTLEENDSLQTQETSSIIWNEIETLLYTDVITQPSINSVTQPPTSTSTTQTSFHSTLPSLFHFLPFRPTSTAIRPINA